MSSRKEGSVDTDDRTVSFSGRNENSGEAMEAKSGGGPRAGNGGDGEGDYNGLYTFKSPPSGNGYPNTKKRPLDPAPPEQGQRRLSVSRRVPAPGATQEAIARLEALKALKSGKSDTIVPNGPVAPQKPAVPRKKVPAPGATQEAIARLANLTTNLHSETSIKTSSQAPPQSMPKGTTTAPRRIPAPGATQEALARLQALKSTGMLPQAQGGGPGNEDIVTGSVVWAKMPSYPWWPAQVQLPSTVEQERLKHGPNDLFVVFYGTADYTWLPMHDLKLFGDHRPEYQKYSSVKNKALQQAISDAWISLGRARP